MIELKEKKLRKELAEVRRTMERNRQRRGEISRGDLERVARYLYWLEAPEARDHLQRVIGTFDADSPYADDLLKLGNFYRMLGEKGQSRQYLERAYAILRRNLNEDNDTGLQYPAQTAFLVRDDEEAERLARRFRELDKKTGKLAIDVVGELARARRTADPALARKAVEEVASMIRKDRAKVSDTGGINLWDWYEIAQQTKAEIESEVSLTPREPERRPSNGVDQQRPEATNASGPDLSGRDLRGDDSIRGANLARANLSRANLHLQSFDETDLSEADLRGADLSRADLTLAVLVDADLRDADLSQTELIETNLQGADLRGAKLVGAECQDPDFSGADLTGVDLSKLDLRGAEFRRAKLRGANLSQADLRHADLSEADLTGANLSGANLEGADLEGAILDNALR